MSNSVIEFTDFLLNLILFVSSATLLLYIVRTYVHKSLYERIFKQIGTDSINNARNAINLFCFSARSVNQFVASDNSSDKDR